MFKGVNRCFSIKRTKSGEYLFEVLFGNKNRKNYIYTLAEAHAIDLIAKTIAKCEIQVYAKNDESGKIEKTKDNMYWRLNIQPNYNENGTMFLYKLVTKLLTDKKALVIINRDIDKSKLLYVADDFCSSNSIMYEKTFSNVIISDNEDNSMTLQKKYTQNDSIYYSIKNSNLDKAKESFRDNSGKILNAVTKKLLHSKIPKWRLKNPGGQPTILDAETKEPISYEKYKEKITEGLFSEEEAIVMLSEIFDLINLNENNSEKINDYKDEIESIGNTVAKTWNIPLDIFHGNKTEKSTGNEDFITFAVSPYFELLEDGLNIGLVGKNDYLKGEYVKFNKFNITHKDIIDSASGIDKLTGDGFSRNEVNELLGLPKIDEKWADKHHLTKNYGELEGGVKENGK